MVSNRSITAFCWIDYTRPWSRYWILVQIFCLESIDIKVQGLYSLWDKSIQLWPLTVYPNHTWVGHTIRSVPYMVTRCIDTMSNNSRPCFEIMITSIVLTKNNTGMLFYRTFQELVVAKPIVLQVRYGWDVQYCFKLDIQFRIESLFTSRFPWN